MYSKCGWYNITGDHFFFFSSFISLSYFGKYTIVLIAIFFSSSNILVLIIVF